MTKNIKCAPLKTSYCKFTPLNKQICWGWTLHTPLIYLKVITKWRKTSVHRVVNTEDDGLLFNSLFGDRLYRTGLDGVAHCRPRWINLRTLGAVRGLVHSVSHFLSSLWLTSLSPSVSLYISHTCSSLLKILLLYLNTSILGLCAQMLHYFKVD